MSSLEVEMLMEKQRTLQHGCRRIVDSYSTPGKTTARLQRPGPAAEMGVEPAVILSLGHCVLSVRMCLGDRALFLG